MVTDRVQQNSELRRNIKCEARSGARGSAQLSRSPAALGLTRAISCPSGARPSRCQGLRKNGE